MRITVLGGAIAMAGMAAMEAGAAWAGADGLRERVLAADAARPVFSFVYGGRQSRDLLATWQVRRARARVDARRTRLTVTWVDPATSLHISTHIVEYRHQPFLEWVVEVENKGSVDTPVLSDLMALDSAVMPASATAPVLHHFTGSPCTAVDYAPHALDLAPGAEKRLAASGGRPSNAELPYFNISGDGGGLVLGIGWPGQWAAAVTRDGAGAVQVRAGQELTHLRLHPGERIRTPLIAVGHYTGDWIDGQNAWRRWMLAHNLPRVRGRLPSAQMLACSSHQLNEMLNANEANQVQFIDGYLDNGLKLDYWWMDAGWYPNKGGWGNTGTWEVDTARFPRGLRHISDHARARGVKTIVWFEPERVNAGTWLFTTHPEWLLGRGDNRLLDLGNRAAWEWLVDHLDKTIRQQGIDLYRTDFNIDPLPFWREADAPDRQGIAENRYCQGFLAYLDELRRRNPSLRIDTCASGGRRNDLETLRRAVPLLRSDYILEPVGQQNHTYGAALWMPYFGTGVNDANPYNFRSQMCPSITACYDTRRTDLDFAAMRTLVRRWRRIGPAWFGDFYPLTPYDAGHAAWMAWQFARPERHTGVVLAFRRAEAPAETLTVKLRGLDAGRMYELRNIDDGTQTSARGSELMDTGFTIRLAAPSAAAHLEYRLQARR